MWVKEETFGIRDYELIGEVGSISVQIGELVEEGSNITKISTLGAEAEILFTITAGNDEGIF